MSLVVNGAKRINHAKSRWREANGEEDVSQSVDNGKPAIASRKVLGRSRHKETEKFLQNGEIE